MARYFRCVALPLILVVGWMPWAHAEDTAKAGSNGSEATLGPVFSKTGPDATLYGEAAGFPLGARVDESGRKHGAVVFHPCKPLEKSPLTSRLSPKVVPVSGASRPPAEIFGRLC